MIGVYCKNLLAIAWNIEVKWKFLLGQMSKLKGNCDNLFQFCDEKVTNYFEEFFRQIRLSDSSNIENIVWL